MAIVDALYALVIFLSALLLFLVEPMTAERLLPALGGSAAVWTTCLVFFQTMLLAGYAYAHLVASRVNRRTQAAVHTTLLALALAALVFVPQPDAAGASFHPLATTLTMLTALIGLPFLALAATTPLLQSWYGSRTGAAAPWRLYALSNAGSLLGLALYPTLIEAHMTLRTQRIAWEAGFGLFAVPCAAIAWRRPASLAVSSPPPIRSADTVRFPARRLLWILLPASGSLLLCDITSHLSQNVAAIPLLWIVPLAAYLLSFIVTFAGPGWYRRTTALRLLAMSLGAVAYLLLEQGKAPPLAFSVPLYTGALFVFCYFAHGELYRLRPAASESTAFYLLLSMGSSLGAIFAGVAEPVLFRANYDLAFGLVLLAAIAVAATWDLGQVTRLFWSAATAALIVAAVVTVRSLDRNSIAQLRSFYGSLRVTETFAAPNIGRQRTLYHGTIEHGMQVFNDQLRTAPTSYYARDSGVGLALDPCCAGAPRRIGVVGLGVGTIAAYGQPGDALTFYEIDPLVERLARARFTYLRESRAQVSVLLGDARLTMAAQPPQAYDVLVLDAFSGDAVPVHLLTAQAVALYRRHLKPGGMLAFHVSSQYIDLKPELAAQARLAGMTAASVHSAGNDSLGEFPADWVLMSADPTFFVQPAISKASRPLPLSQIPAWTDDFNSLLPLIRWTGLTAER